MLKPSPAGLGETIANARLMELVEQALLKPQEEREAFLREACGDNDFSQAWNYVQWEERMQGFLLDPAVPRESAGQQLHPGDVLGNRFQIVRELAQGGMGVVYESQDLRLGRRIALKCAKAGHASGLPPEVRNATEVSHPNVCKIYEIHTAKTEQGLLDFITMEFLEGETLAVRLGRGRVAEKEATEIARQLAAGMAEAHRKGVIHGDIKSSNVMLTKDEDGDLRAVITDFGLARKKGSRSEGIWGTPGYMAPELWLGSEASTASDIYALGVVIYEMVSGHRPSEEKTTRTGDSQTLVATQWLDVAQHKPPRLNNHWDTVLARCLDPDPVRRYQNAAQIAHALAPGYARRNIIIATAAALLAAVTGVVTYRTATAPQEKVKLALDVTGLSQAPAEIARLRGNPKLEFEVLTGRMHGETHVLRARATPSGKDLLVRAKLEDARTGTTLRDWQARYAPDQMKYAPGAVAGVLSAALHLTPLPESTTINPRAAHDYQVGAKAIRFDETVDQGLGALEKAAAADPDSAVVRASLAEAQWMKYRLTNDKDWLARATETVRQAELRYPDTATGHRAAALLKVTAGQPEEAQAEYQRAVELEPANAENYRRLGSAYETNNQPERALVAYRKAVDLEPDYFKNQYKLGYFYSGQARYKDAVEHLSAAVRLAPNDEYSRVNLAEAYTFTGQFSKALGELNVVLARREIPLARSLFGKVLMYQGKDREAEPHFVRALKEDPERYIDWWHLGIVQRHLGHLAASKDSMLHGKAIVEKLLASEPRRSDVRACLAYFVARLGDWPRAELEASEAVKLASTDTDTLAFAAMTYEILGRRDASLATLKHAPVELLEDLSRWPDLADLSADSRFKEMTANNAAK